MSGRSAWTTRGKDNNTRQYQYIKGLPLDGSSALLDNDHYAINQGVRALQGALNKLPSTSGLLTKDGLLGEKTSLAIKSAQSAWGLTPNGIAGRDFCAKLFRPLIVSSAALYSFDPKYLYAQIAFESNFDSGAAGYSHEPDRGLVQINTETEGVTIEQAHNPDFAVPWSAKRFRAALDKYSKKGTDLQIRSTILSHNSPASADKLYSTSSYPSDTSRNYVEKVLEFATEF